jgi:hypothetical protein
VGVACSSDVSDSVGAFGFVGLFGFVAFGSKDLIGLWGTKACY